MKSFPSCPSSEGNTPLHILNYELKQGVFCTLVFLLQWYKFFQTLCDNTITTVNGSYVLHTDSERVTNTVHATTFKPPLLRSSNKALSKLA